MIPSPSPSRPLVGVRGARARAARSRRTRAESPPTVPLRIGLGVAVSVSRRPRPRGRLGVLSPPDPRAGEGDGVVEPTAQRGTVGSRSRLTLARASGREGASNSPASTSMGACVAFWSPVEASGLRMWTEWLGQVGGKATYLNLSRGDRRDVSHEGGRQRARRCA